jgi:tetratricopeptide (TPR) repeat protein
MTKMLNVLARAAVVALWACALSAPAPAAAAARPRQNQNQKQPPPQPPKKKKLPPGVRGFEQFAGRDASDKLITAGATRSLCKTDTAENALRCGTAYLTAEAPDYTRAVEALSRAVALDPKMFRAQFRLGLAYEGAGRYKEAAEAYRRALALNPAAADLDSPADPFYAQYNLANSYALAGQHREAVEVYRKLVANLPNPLAQPYYNLGLSLAALGDQQAAADAFRKAVEIKPGYAEAHYNLGLLSVRAERYAEAVDHFRQALRAKPGYAEAHYNLGLVYYLTDDRAGLAEQQKALQIMKSDLAAELARLSGK